jgi:hypothetical protein
LAESVKRLNNFLYFPCSCLRPSSTYSTYWKIGIGSRDDRVGCDGVVIWPLKDNVTFCAGGIVQAGVHYGIQAVRPRGRRSGRSSSRRSRDGGTGWIRIMASAADERLGSCAGGSGRRARRSAACGGRHPRAPGGGAGRRGGRGCRRGAMTASSTAPSATSRL